MLGPASQQVRQNRTVRQHLLLHLLVVAGDLFHRVDRVVHLPQVPRRGQLCNLGDARRRRGKPLLVVGVLHAHDGDALEHVRRQSAVNHLRHHRPLGRHDRPTDHQVRRQQAAQHLQCPSLSQRILRLRLGQGNLRDGSHRRLDHHLLARPQHGHQTFQRACLARRILVLVVIGHKRQQRSHRVLLQQKVGRVQKLDDNRQLILTPHLLLHQAVVEAQRGDEAQQLALDVRRLGRVQHLKDACEPNLLHDRLHRCILAAQLC
mmetsp:Transcript_9225/g.29384  ORF Transcript_9225/g.29384 Transcript_9225/m.29384 type:complete len:262 (-) Transcript_9225:85-870(-)